jgi:hypothetical protein
MSINVKLSEDNRIRVSSSEITIRPSLFLGDLNDVTTVDTENKNILIFSAALRRFVSSEVRSSITIKNVFGGQF